ncbi:MAG: FAD-binding and (Fe-S)-binding domain-containing protein [Spirochaetaceae bacterium]|jgi:Fe-S oxidoreductase/FAD/FMN-containing dehydrogenase|nr:FAD-binding and (Fe-S)-binding domain-containing protein [Spirochaetaceae bacterium]
MGRLNKIQKEYLSKFGDNARFDRTERILYSHDVGALPSIVKPLIGNTRPDAIVQPSNEEELVDLIKWAVQENIPLTPRGRATSGYAGAVPAKHGIVVDFIRMKKVLHIDEKNLIATVEPGITWEMMDDELKKKKLTLKLYPTSYPASSAGGWLAQGGAGIGSYESGYFVDNVVSARVVSPDGSIKEFSGDELDMISEAEGITGFISQMKIKIMAEDKMAVKSFSVESPDDFQKINELIIESSIPVWSIMFINPKMAELKNKAPLRMHNDHEAEEKIILPVAYIGIVTFREKDREAVEAELLPIIKEHKGSMVDDHISAHEWENRFNLMVVKRLGPSLVPSEVVVPLENLGPYLKKVGEKIHQPIVKEGIIIKNLKTGKNEVVLLGFIPADQRKFSYNLVFTLSMSIIRLAKKFGGRAYTTGMYFSHEANSVMGADRVKRMRKYKKEIDSKNILNPGKVIAKNPVSMLIGTAEIFEPMIRPFGNAIATKVGERIKAKTKDLPSDVAWYSYACSQCGYCVDSCTQFKASGWESESPRGKFFWLREYQEGRVDWDQKTVNNFLGCTTCEVCDTRCSVSIPIEPSWMKLRGKMIVEDKKMSFPPFEMMKAATAAEGNIWAHYRENRDKWFPEDLLEKHGPGVKSKAIYFAGCTASYVENDIAMASVRMLDEAGIDFSYLGKKENCCAIPMLVSGNWAQFEATMRENIQNVKDAGADTVISSCPACNLLWSEGYPKWAEKLGIDFDIKGKHYSEMVAEKIKSGEFKFPENDMKPIKVTWHDSCHLGRASGIYEEPRELIKAIPNVELVEMQHNRETAFCCGSVLSLVKNPDTAVGLGELKLKEAMEVEAEKMLALCPCCEVQLRNSVDKTNSPMEVQDLAHFVSSALGYDFPDPHPEVRKQWGVFEAFIKLMTPEGFAKLMGTMWPELVDAMPLGMGGMMHGMGKIPGALNLMKPMFPLLFPILLPKMMPKVLPVMLDKIYEMIPTVPDYMKEQMPEMMPKVMNHLMPHMIGDLVPLITDPMIAYLQKKETVQV